MRLKFLEKGWILLAWLCLFEVMQGGVQNGMLPAFVPSIETTFNLTSTKAGALASVNDAILVFAVIPISLATNNMPLWLGIGMLSSSLGTLFLGFSYPIDPENAGAAYGILVFGQLLNGFGGSTLSVLGPVYLTENTTQRSLSLYMGIFYAFGAIAAALGFGIGGVVVGKWVWWRGFIMMGFISLFLAIPFFFMPKQLPRELIETDNPENDTEKDERILPYFGKAHDFKGKSLKEAFSLVFGSFFAVIRNIPFLFNALATATKVFSVSAFIIFLPKFTELSLGLPPLNATLLVGATTVPGAALGIIFSGYLIKRLNASTQKAMFICLIFSLIAPFFSWVFLMGSPAAFYPVLVILQFISFGVEAPLPTILMRIVRPEDRGMAMGIANIIVRCLGAIPGPVVLGYLIDTTCENPPCLNDDDYGVTLLRQLFFRMSISVLLISCVLVLCQLLTWKRLVKKIKQARESRSSSLSSKDLNAPYILQIDENEY